MSKRVLSVVLILLWFTGVLAANASQIEAPTISIQQALDMANRHVTAEKLEVSEMYIAKAEWNPRSGLVSFWRIEWRTRKPVKGGHIFVKVYADGKVEHAFGE